MDKVLSELEPVALSEQLFCIRFFQLDVLSPTTRNTQTTLDGAMTTSVGPSDGSDKDGVFWCILSEKFDFFTIFSVISVIGLVPQKRVDRQINEEVRRMMTSLFSILETELNSFINSFEKLDSL